MSLFSKIYKEPFPKYDIPVDYVMDDNVSGSILELYKMFPCKIKAGVFAICLSGGAKVTLNLSEYIVKENDFITVIPGSFLQIHEIYENTSLAFIGFSSNFINTINFWKNITLNLAEVINNPILHLPREIAIFYRDSISLIMKAEEAPIKLLDSNIMASIMEVFYKIHAIIYKTSNVQIAEKGPRELEVLREFIRLAFENYPQEHKATFYANEIGLTLSHFCATIKKATGKTAQDIIRQLIIMDAKAQLKSSDARINKIAKSLGFTPTAFNRYFLEYVKMTPQEYRNS